MQSFTKEEITWIAREMAGLSRKLETAGAMTGTSRIASGLCQLRAEQYKSIAERLTKAIEEGNRSLKIRNT